MSAGDRLDTGRPPAPEAGCPGPRFSRRTFIKGVGAAAVSSATAVARAEAPGRESVTSGASPVLGPGEVPLVLAINRKRYALSVEPRETLAEVLRERLGMTGTKEACERGTCGSCTVWIDGEVVNACLTLAVDLDRREITTIEGLSGAGGLHPVQAAFRDNDALQCGYCTPGMIMSSAALLARSPHPTDAEIREAVAGNLCRCGTYPKIYKAVRQASGMPRAEGGEESNGSPGDVSGGRSG